MQGRLLAFQQTMGGAFTPNGEAVQGSLPMHLPSAANIAVWVK